ncbi:TRAP-type C4-dicarboxylate transport system [Peptoniphilus sp. ING2-D1G]|nr:TRAP-type C4-dicarboxylate transport system [Peptoniphilus sp. ING2-D1G]
MEIVSLLFISFFILAFLNIPIAVALGISSFLCMYFFGYDLSILPTQVYSGIAKFVLLAVPFFILSGNIMDKSGISSRLIRFVNSLVGHKKGGLIYATVIASLFFAAISGSGPACVAALGSILIPAMERNGYGRNFPSALMATGGSIGTVIPPSIPFVMYGLVTSVSITKLFMAGFIPGLLLGLVLIFTAKWQTKDWNIVLREKAGSEERKQAFVQAIPAIMMPVIILGGIYSGIFSPTEAAAVSCVYGLIVGFFIYKTLTIKTLYELFRTSVISAGNIMLVIAGASLFAWFCSVSGITQMISNSLLNIAGNQFKFLIIVNIVLLIAGCFVDSTSAIYLFCPIFVPVAKTLGYDLTALGVVFIVNLAIGNITPPIGLNLFCACSVGKTKITDVVKYSLPQLLGFLIILILITYIPKISTFLPILVYGSSL